MKIISPYTRLKEKYDALVEEHRERDVFVRKLMLIAPLFALLTFCLGLSYALFTKS